MQPAFLSWNVGPCAVGWLGMTSHGGQLYLFTGHGPHQPMYVCSTMEEYKAKFLLVPQYFLKTLLF